MAQDASTTIEELFEKTINEAEGDRPFRSRIDRGEDRRDFEQTLDPESSPSDFDTEGNGFDVDVATNEIVAEMYDRIDSVEEMVKSLNDPNSDQSLNRFLARVDKTDSIGSGLSDKLSKLILKGANAISEIKNTIENVLGREEVILKKIASTKS